MKIIDSPKAIGPLVASWKSAGEKVALVPTMGCLHEGHLSLVRLAKGHAQKVVVSIFVNPMQFGPNEDFAAYPRQFAEDCRLLQEEGVDVVFAPKAEDMYPAGFQTRIRVEELAKGYCGGSRPGHFDGVATVVAKLFLLTGPDVAVFGQKDFQQLALIKRMVMDLAFPLTVIGAPIVREPDGLAMSSRNKYLTGDSRAKAICLYQGIQAAKDLVSRHGCVKALEVVDLVRGIIEQAGVEVDYVQVADAITLQTCERVTEQSVLLVAARVDGKVRLIDNASLWTKNS